MTRDEAIEAWQAFLTGGADDPPEGREPKR
jgi:hypothetical protein